MISAHVVGAREAAAAFLHTASTTQAKLAGAVALHGKQYQAAVKRRASGRPGPNVITGKYRNSIKFRMVRSGLTPAAEVYTEAPQARRLELGFAGVDSLGRTFHQPPFPHWEQDVKATADGLQRTIGAIVDESTR